MQQALGACVSLFCVLLISFRRLIEAKVCRELQDQCQQLCATSRPSLFCKSDAQSLVTLSIPAILTEWAERAPLFFNLMAAAAGVAESTTDNAAVVTAAGILLHKRNMHTATVPQSIGLMLDFGDATDKTLSAMYNLGISAATSTILMKKTAIVEDHEKLLQETIIQR